MDSLSILSIVQGSLELAAKCVTVVKYLNDFATKHQQAELFVLSLVDECQTLHWPADESAWTIVNSQAPASIRDTDSIMTIGNTDLVYRRLDFENYLFTARVYKRNFRKIEVRQLFQEQAKAKSKLAIVTTPTVDPDDFTIVDNPDTEEFSPSEQHINDKFEFKMSLETRLEALASKPAKQTKKQRDKMRSNEPQGISPKTTPSDEEVEDVKVETIKGEAVIPAERDASSSDAETSSSKSPGPAVPTEMHEADALRQTLESLPGIASSESRHRQMEEYGEAVIVCEQEGQLKEVRLEGVESKIGGGTEKGTHVPIPGQSYTPALSIDSSTKGYTLESMYNKAIEEIKTTHASGNLPQDYFNILTVTTVIENLCLLSVINR
ncbi:hypothetical protein OEA41_003456 [Lepraria neglecta]|uniref:Uncharacterized protein n=1 Tax=Lepraria neglecta TaxID=209136 RepID=A0AAE0DIC2_9LECA|nr:hypothetical protein OEA41_003456 [Lepraria neglecta]